MKLQSCHIDLCSQAAILDKSHPLQMRSMMELEKLRSQLPSNSVVQRSFYMLIPINHKIHSFIIVYFKYITRNSAK